MAGQLLEESQAFFFEESQATHVEDSQDPVVNPTVLDEGCAEEPGPPFKKARLQVDPVEQRDGIRWICSPKGQWIPYVKKADSGIVHCGNIQMQIIKEKENSRVLCLSGCQEKPCGSCSCYCHLLQDFYIYRRDC